MGIPSRGRRARGMRRHYPGGVSRARLSRSSGGGASLARGGAGDHPAVESPGRPGPSAVGGQSSSSRGRSGSCSTPVPIPAGMSIGRVGGLIGCRRNRQVSSRGGCGGPRRGPGASRTLGLRRGRRVQRGGSGSGRGSSSTKRRAGTLGALGAAAAARGRGAGGACLSSYPLLVPYGLGRAGASLGLRGRNSQRRQSGRSTLSGRERGQHSASSLQGGSGCSRGRRRRRAGSHGRTLARGSGSRGRGFPVSRRGRRGGERGPRVPSHRLAEEPGLSQDGLLSSLGVPRAQGSREAEELGD